MNESQLIQNGWIELGSGVNTHGIKGGITLNLFNNDLKNSVLNYANENEISAYLIVTKNPKLSKNYTIVKASLGNKPIIYLAGMNKLEDVEPLIPFRLFVNREDFPETDSDDEFYNVDLIGLPVFASSGEAIGKLDSIYENGPQSIFVILIEGNPKLEREYGRTLEIPYVENFVKSIDVEARKIVIELPEYES